MLTVLKNYFSHSTVIGFFLFLISGLYFITSSSLLIDNFYWFFVPIILAPFYEWYVHKYQLHAELTKKDGWYRRYQILLHHGHHRDPDNIAADIKHSIIKNLKSLENLSKEEIYDHRKAKFLQIGRDQGFSKSTDLEGRGLSYKGSNMQRDHINVSTFSHHNT